MTTLTQVCTFAHIGGITFNLRPYYTNAHCRLADWQVNKVNSVVKCFNRFPILKLYIFEMSNLGIENLLEHFTTVFTLFTCQYARLQSTFVAHRCIKL